MEILTKDSKANCIVHPVGYPKGSAYSGGGTGGRGGGGGAEGVVTHQQIW